MDMFVFIATVIFAFLFMVWKSSNITNILMKFMMLVMAVCGAVLSAQILGFVVKV